MQQIPSLRSFPSTLTAVPAESSSGNPIELITDPKSFNGNIRQPMNSLDCFKAPFDLACSEPLEIPYKPYLQLNGSEKQQPLNSHEHSSQFQGEVTQPRRGSSSSVQQARVKRSNKYPLMG